MSQLSPVVGAVLGAAIVGAAWAFVGSGEPDAPTTDTTIDLAGSASQIEVLDRLERIEERIDSIAAELHARPTRSSDAESGPGLDGHPMIDVPTRDGDRSTPTVEPVITDEVLEKTLERLEAKKFAGFSDAALKAEARRLLNRERDLHGAKGVLERLLERDLEPVARAEALTDLGSVHRSMNDLDASETALREAMRIATDKTQAGVQAGYHLIWTLKRAGREPQALAMADDLVDAQGMTPQMRPWMRWAAATMAYDTGDHGRANADYQALLDEFRGQKKYEQIVKDAVKKLRERN